MSSVIAGEARLREAIRPTRMPGLFLLPCGPVPANPSELLAGKRFGQLMRSLVGTFDRIVIDSPPLMSVADARILAASADATLLVLRMNQSVRRFGIMALDGLEKVGANVLGAIANDTAPMPESRYYRGSWQYASSARRVMASVGARLKQPDIDTDTNGSSLDSADPSDQQYFAGAAGNQSGPPIDEPDWSVDGGAGEQVAELVAGDSDPSHANGNANGNGHGHGHGHGW